MASVIKSGQAATTLPSPVVAQFNFQDMASKAEACLATVREQASRILADARREALAIESQARESGRQAAAQDAVRLADAQLETRLQSLIPALTTAIDSLRAARTEWLEHWEQQAVGLATAIASRIIRRELAADPDIPQTWVREALELIAGESRVILRLHPQDCQTLGDRARLIAGQLSQLAVLEVVADPSLEPGGCRVDTEFGTVDLQVSVQLRRIAEELAAG